MYIYIIIIILLLISILICKTEKKKENAFFFIGILLCLVLTFRNIDLLGIDIKRYNRVYQIIAFSDFNDAVNIRSGRSVLYFLLNYLFAKNGISFRLFVISVSLFSCAVTLYFIKEYNVEPLFGILFFLGLGLYSFQFSGLKQSLSMAFALLSIDNSRKNRKFLELLFFIVSSLLHITALVILPYIIIKHIKINQKTIFIMFLSLFIFLIFRVRIARILTMLFTENYLDSFQSINVIGGLTYFYLFICVLYIWCFNERAASPLYINSSIYQGFSIILLTTSIQLCSSYSYLFTRLNLYYVPLLAENASLILKSGRIMTTFRQSKIIVFTIKMIFAFILIYLFFINIEDNGLSQYLFFWQM